MNHIGSIPSVLSDRIRIRKTFADSELTPFINVPYGVFRQPNYTLSPVSVGPNADDFMGSRRLKMLAESYQKTSSGTDSSLMEIKEDFTPRKKLSFSIESILA